MTGLSGLDKKWVKALGHEVVLLSGGYNVTSADSGNTYRVRLLQRGAHTCTCTYGASTPGGICSHFLAVMRIVAANKGYAAEWPMTEAERQAEIAAGKRVQFMRLSGDVVLVVRETATEAVQ